MQTIQLYIRGPLKETLKQLGILTEPIEQSLASQNETTEVTIYSGGKQILHAAGEPIENEDKGAKNIIESAVILHTNNVLTITHINNVPAEELNLRQ